MHADCCKTSDIEQHANRVFRLGGKRNPDTPLSLQLAYQSPPFGSNKCAGSRRDESCRNINCSALGSACLKFGDDLKNSTTGERVEAHLTFSIASAKKNAR